MAGKDPHKSPARPGVFRRRMLWLAGGLLVLGFCAAVRYYWGPDPATAGSPADAARPAPTAAPPKLDVMAQINGEKISRAELAHEALIHHGKEVLSSLTNKYVVAQQCQQRGITVTAQEVQDEINYTAKKFQLPVDQYLKMLETERSINPAQYADDIIWPTIALRKLAAERVQPTEEEVQKAYETQFGPAVQGRIIVCKSEEKARQVLALARQNPDDFGNLAKQYSEDPSAAAKGMIHPIRKHMGDPRLEQAAFNLRPGEISEVIPVMHQFVIVMCDAQLPPRNVPFEEKRQLLWEACRDKKLRLAGEEIFTTLRQEARVEDIYSTPGFQDKYPGVAAMINNQPFTIAQLSEECIARNGKEVLEIVIHRRLIEQEGRKKNIQISEEEMQAEVARAAVDMGYLTPENTPDIKAWLEFVEKKEGTSLDVYRNDSVRPSAVLKKLVTGKIEITQEDLQKGYESNYGPRVRCRAIVFNQLRKAQEAFEKARQTPTVEHFGDLAEEYSIEPGSRVLRGEIPPIQRHSGQPQLEKAAFELKPGELSHIVQLGDKFVLLFCEGSTKPVAVNFDEVRQFIFEDVYRKKLFYAMNQEFQRLSDTAQIDNYLVGTTQTPAAKRPQLAAAPASSAAAPVQNLVLPASATGPVSGDR